MAKVATKTPPKPAAKDPPRPASKPAPASAKPVTSPSRPAPPAARSAALAAPKPGLPAIATRSGPVAISTDMSSVPEFMRGDLGAGRENIRQQDIEVPRLKLIQGISPELQEYDELRAGNFLHTASETIFDEPFLAVPIFMDVRYMLWRPRNDAGGGILARADDGEHWSPPDTEFTVKLDRKDGGQTVTWTTRKTVRESGLAEWGSLNPDDPKSPPAATLMYNFLLAFPEHPDVMPAVMTFQRSSVRMGRKFNSKLISTRDPIYGLVFRISSFVDHNGAGEEFYNIQTAGYGKISDPLAYADYKKLHESFRAMGLNIKDLEGAQEDTSDGDSTSTNGDNPMQGKPGY